MGIKLPGGDELSWPVISGIATIAAIMLTGYAVSPHHGGAVSTLVLNTSAALAWGVAFVLSVVTWFGE